MNYYKKIAVAIDFSEHSIKAFEKATSIALHHKATLVLANVVDTRTFGSIAAYDLKLKEQMKAENLVQLKSLKEQALAKGIESVEISLEEGSPKEILTQLPNVDLILCGETGYNKFEKFMLGSVADRILRLSKYDVLIVK